MYSILMFSIGFFLFERFRFVGAISISELIAFACFPLVIAESSKKPSLYFKFIGYSALYIAAVSASDLYNSNHFELFLRGVAKPFFLLYMFMFYYFVLVKKVKSATAFAYGICSKSIIENFELAKNFLTGGYVDYGRFVTGMTPILVFAAVIASTFFFRRQSKISSLLFIGLAFVMLYQDSRTFFVVCGLTATIIYFAQNSIKFQQMHRFIHEKKPIKVLVILALILMPAMYFTYIILAPNGHLGEYTQAKFEQQSSSKFGATPWGIILSGRTDLLIQILAILDKPIFGQGSWADYLDFHEEAYEMLGLRTNVSLSTKVRDFGMLRSPGHSILFGTWGNSGVLAFVFWVFFTRQLVLLAGKLFKVPTPITPLIAYAISFIAWSLFFSPLGTLERTLASFLMAVAVWFSRIPILPPGRHPSAGEDQSHLHPTH